MLKDRDQNPTVGDTITLRLFMFNSNNQADVSSIETVEIYRLDPDEVTQENPDGRILIDTFAGSVVSHDGAGQYSLAVPLTDPKYIIGNYIDVWTVAAIANQPTQQAINSFVIYPELWYAMPKPVVYDFDFHFQPNRMRQGSIQYLRIEIVPNVPKASDLQQYYTNLAISADLSISIEQSCGPCVPQESDLRLIVDNQSVDYREKRFGYYQLDTTDLDCGIYNVWFQLLFGGNTYLSDKMQLQIY